MTQIGWPLSWSMFISDYSTARATQLVFSVSLFLGAALAGLFGLWIHKKTVTNRGFMISLYAVVALQILVAWLPGQGRTGLAHQIFAMLELLLLPVITYYFLQTVYRRVVRILISTMLVVQLLAVFLIPVLWRLGVPLVAEFATAVACHACLVVTTVWPEWKTTAVERVEAGSEI
jgi:hypothetical protein